MSAPSMVQSLVEGMVPWHMGELHAYEQALVLLLAFGPVLLLAVTVWIARRRIDDDDR